MPYIDQNDRSKFQSVLDKLPRMKSKGELEFCIYRLMQLYMADREERYSDLHDTVYAAAHCADEFRRRRLDARENEARLMNGDV